MHHYGDLAKHHLDNTEQSNKLKAQLRNEVQVFLR